MLEIMRAFLQKIELLPRSVLWFTLLHDILSMRDAMAEVLLSTTQQFNHSRSKTLKFLENE